MTGLLLHILFPNLSVCTKFVHLGFHERRGLKVSCGMHARQTRFTRLRNITSCFLVGFYTYPQLTSGRSDEYAHRVAHRRHHSPPELASSPPSGEQREREREKPRA